MVPGGYPAASQAGEAEDRLMAWAAMQREAPDLAAFLRAVAEVFGKPEEVRAVWRAWT